MSNLYPAGTPIEIAPRTDDPLPDLATLHQRHEIDPDGFHRDFATAASSCGFCAETVGQIVARLEVDSERGAALAAELAHIGHNDVDALAEWVNRAAPVLGDREARRRVAVRRSGMTEAELRASAVGAMRDRLGDRT